MPGSAVVCWKPDGWMCALGLQVDDLRERMRLLQGDRRANVEIIQANKDANKDEIKRYASASQGVGSFHGSLSRVHRFVPLAGFAKRPKLCERR